MTRAIAYVVILCTGIGGAAGFALGFATAAMIVRAALSRLPSSQQAFLAAAFFALVKRRAQPAPKPAVAPRHTLTPYVACTACGGGACKLKEWPAGDEHMRCTIHPSGPVATCLACASADAWFQSRARRH